MADFHQSNTISTLHRLGSNRINSLEHDLKKFSRNTGMGLVLPALISEFERPAMGRIIEQLRDVRYLSRIVVAIGKATREQVNEAAALFKDFRSPVSVIWMEDPIVKDAFRSIEKRGFRDQPYGKGRTCWFSFGYLLAEGSSDMIALHDCDIVNYTRDIPASLCYPLAHPDMDFDFCKGYYPRVSDRLHGRVTRLFMAPLLQAVSEIIPKSAFVNFLSEFRYPLAGEFSMKASLAQQLRMPSDWGLEVGVLSEVFQHSGPSRVCQADIAENYDHKHQEVSANDASKGLRRMTLDIARTLLNCIKAQGVTLRASDLKMLDSFYRHFAENKIRQYQADAVMNGLIYNRMEENAAVESFAFSLDDALKTVTAQAATADATLPSWNQVEATVPGITDHLLNCTFEESAPVRVFLPNWIQQNARKPVFAGRVV